MVKTVENGVRVKMAEPVIRKLVLVNVRPV